MNTKPATPTPKLKPLDMPQRIIPVAWLRQSPPVQCRVTQPGYYLIGLRLRMQHIQRQGRSTPGIQ
jgi:hypothetical protein